MFFTGLFTALIAASAALAVPSRRVQTTMCRTDDSLPRPSTENNPPTPLAPTPSEGPRFIALAVGVQNYTCSTNNVYTYVLSSSLFPN